MIQFSTVPVVFFTKPAVAQLVEALRYKPEGRGFDSRWCHLNWHNPSGRTMTLGSTQLLTEMITRDISWRVEVAGAYAWQTHHLHLLIVMKSGSLKLLKPSGPVQTCTGIQGRIKLFGAPRQWKHFRPLFQAVFFRGEGGGYYPPRLSQTPRLPVPRQK